MTFPLHFDPDHNLIEFNGELMSFHCHHFNCGLLKAIEEITVIDGHAIIKETAAEQFFIHFKDILSNEKQRSLDQNLRKASELYRFMGFGRLDLSRLTAEGGTASADASYYVVSWLAKYGRRTTPVCYFTCGFIAGILAAIFEADPYTYKVEETQCMILRHNHCHFLVSKRINGN